MTEALDTAGMSRQERRECLVELYREVESCRRCPLAETRTRAVFGAGNADADLVMVGEAPGADEDRQGLPFVGRAGKLLDQLLGDAGITREEIFIANVLKSRPPGNRDPQPEEIEACRPYLERQLQLIRPRVVATMGNFSTKLLSGSPEGITKVRGRPRPLRIAGLDVVLLPIYHPAFALRSTGAAETLGADLRLLPGLMALEPAAGG